MRPLDYISIFFLFVDYFHMCFDVDYFHMCFDVPPDSHSLALGKLFSAFIHRIVLALWW